MKTKIINWLFEGIVLSIVILLFTIFDHYFHGLEDKWSVPDYYFKDKIPFGFLWGVVGLFLVSRVSGLNIKALILSGVVAMALQTRYFLTGYPFDFVVIFLFIHFIILFVLSYIMFRLFKRYL